MARRIALARAIALDPELVMYDEPFSGLDPISLGTAARLIRQLNDSMGLTSIFVSHELEQTFAIADHVIILANGKIATQGTPDQVRQSTDPLVYQYVNALSDGPVVQVQGQGQPLEVDGPRIGVLHPQLELKAPLQGLTCDTLDTYDVHRRCNSRPRQERTA
jgi:ABC-type transporter Mla maintaining outer membrane lipid asymmetry ATPase subunit MlaF